MKTMQMEDSRLTSRQAIMRPLGEIFNSIVVKIHKFLSQDQQKFIYKVTLGGKTDRDAQMSNMLP